MERDARARKLAGGHLIGAGANRDAIGARFTPRRRSNLDSHGRRRRQLLLVKRSRVHFAGLREAGRRARGALAVRKVEKRKNLPAGKTIEWHEGEALTAAADKAGS